MWTHYAFLDANMAKVERSVEKRQRKPPMAPVRNEQERQVIREFMARLWDLLQGPGGDNLLAGLRRLKQLPQTEQDKAIAWARSVPVTAFPASAHPFVVTMWMLRQALRRGFVLPGLQRQDLFLAFVDGMGLDEDIAAVMGRSRDWRAAANDNDRRLDQRKVMTRRSRLNARRRKLGYPNL